MGETSGNVGRVLKASLVLVALVAGLTVTVIVSGLHRKPEISIPIFIFGAVLLDVAVVFWALRGTAATQPYGRQLMDAALIGAIGGALIFLTSLLLTGVLFPDFLAESKAAQAALLEASLPQGPQLDDALARNAARTPVAEAFGGFVGTLGTSILGGAVLAVFLRRK